MCILFVNFKIAVRNLESLVTTVDILIYPIVIYILLTVQRLRTFDFLLFTKAIVDDRFKCVVKSLLYSRQQECTEPSVYL